MTTTTPRKRSWSWTQIEAEYALPMREILVTLYVEHGTKAAIARVLNVQASAVNDWWMRSGLPELQRTAHTQTGDPMTGVQQTEAQS